MRLHVMGCILEPNHMGSCGIPQKTSEGTMVAAKQVGGSHYKDKKIQPWDIIDALDLNFYEGNALKYLLRYKDKNGVEDLRKAMHYIEKLIEMEISK